MVNSIYVKFEDVKESDTRTGNAKPIGTNKSVNNSITKSRAVGKNTQKPTKGSKFLGSGVDYRKKLLPFISLSTGISAINIMKRAEESPYLDARTLALQGIIKIVGTSIATTITGASLVAIFTPEPISTATGLIVLAGVGVSVAAERAISAIQGSANTKKRIEYTNRNAIYTRSLSGVSISTRY